MKTSLDLVREHLLLEADYNANASDAEMFRTAAHHLYEFKVLQEHLHFLNDNKLGIACFQADDPSGEPTRTLFMVDNAGIETARDTLMGCIYAAMSKFILNPSLLINQHETTR